ncbi:MAG: hypothetical protein HY831_01615 [Candidatus Aenigmarchaeota archaeon]|nr:hypothetical protein [Candidatus Aenigmarchaeota archaeon]
MSELSIFRAYDVRGIYGSTINETICKKIGAVLGHFINNDTKHDTSIIYVARDVRLSSESLQKSFVEGVLSQGKNIIDLGTLPLTVAAFYAWKSQKYLVYITASHMSKEWNGIKFFTPEGIGFSEPANNEIKKLYVLGVPDSKRFGDYSFLGNEKAIEQYKNLLLFKLTPKKKLTIVTDAGNGVADFVVKDLFKKAGHTIISLNSKPDGNFPNRKVDPNEDSLKELRETISAKNADMGIAFDGDADRVVVLNEKGKKIPADHLAFLLLKEIYKTQSGPVIANVECSYVVDDVAKQHSQKVIRVPVGDTYLMEGVHEFKAVLGIEKSGHACVPSLVPCDDAIAIAYYLSCTLDGKMSISEILKQVPQYHFDRVNFPCSDDVKTMIMEKIRKQIFKKYGSENTTTLDGIRVDFENSWILIRQSNTEPLIRLTIEAKKQEDLTTLKDQFIQLIEKHII